MPYHLAKFAASVTFTIPMRGNEYRGPKGERLENGEFTIPMRGNEAGGHRGSIPVRGPLDVYRAAGRLEVHLDDLLESYDEIREWQACGADAHALDLLEGAYCHVLTEVLDWLEGVVEAIADPVAAAKVQGAPTSGKVSLNLWLTITDPPELAELQHSFDRGRASGRGYWGTVGAVVVGCALGDWLFGGGDE